MRAVINDGAFHAVDSSEMAFKTAALMGFREAYAEAKPTILEPIMKVEVAGARGVPGLGRRSGQPAPRRHPRARRTARATSASPAEVPLNEMFGYSTDLRSATQGKGKFTMEFAKYAPVPKQEQEEMMKKYREKLAAERR